ncbi:MAG: hypothetical protein KGJ86_18235, partial [Chloroflexota bacterium]|nr:hypothetical protein [Chloroflexota bacterium]
TIIGGTGLVVVKYRLSDQPIWLVFMEVIGYLLFFTAIGMFDPRQRRLARLAANPEQGSAFRSLNRRHAVTASIAGALMILVIAAATFKPGS